MPEPTRPTPRDFAKASEPLTVVKLEVEFPDAYRPGDTFDVVGLLNRPLTAYEQRLVSEQPIGGRWPQYVGYKVVLERTTLDDFSLTGLQESLRELSSRAAEQQRAAESDIDEAHRGISALNSELP